MNHDPHRSITLFKVAHVKGKRQLPTAVLAAIFIAVVVLVSGAFAQKSGTPPGSDPVRDRANAQRTRSPLTADVNSREHVPQLFRQHTIELAADCSLDPLRAFLDDMLAAGELKEEPVLIGNQLRIVIADDYQDDLTVVPCVEEVVPGWPAQPRPSQPGASPPAEELRQPFIEERPRKAAVAAGTGSISGTVTAEVGGAPLYDIDVCVYIYDEPAYADPSWQWVDCEQTDASGHYTVGGLSPGTYLVEFYDDFYAWEFYEGATDVYDATYVRLARSSAISGIDAALAQGGYITGTVTADAGGSPLNELTIYAYYDNGMGWWRRVAGFSDEDGTYTIGGLQTGTYLVGFFAKTYIGGFGMGFYAFEFYGDTPDMASAADVSVTLGSTTSGIDASLADGGHISGTVTAEDGGYVDDDDTEVCSYFYTGSQWWIFECDYYVSDGDYRLEGLATGNYRVGYWYYGDYMSEFYNGAPDLESATDVPATAGTTIYGIDASLKRLGHITGTVAAETGGVPLDNIKVCAYYNNGGDWDIRACDNTDAAGNYDIEFYYAGAHRLRFSDPQGLYVPEYYNDVAQIYQASDVWVYGGSTTSGIDAALSDAGRISGTVTADGSGAPLSAIFVCAQTYDGLFWSSIGCEYSDANGNYKISLPGDTYYRVAFSDEYGYYAAESISSVLVHVGYTTSGIDAALTELGHIAGRVTAGVGGAPVQDITVCARSYEGFYWWKSISCDKIYPNGSYNIDLPVGTYRVRFFDNSGSFATEYYDGVSDIENAADLFVTEGNTISGIDAALAEAGYISGTVTADADGSPLYDIEVCANYDNGLFWNHHDCSYTDYDGTYTLGPLRYGYYRVGFFDWEYEDFAFEYYDDTPDIDSAADVPVTAGGTTSGIDASLADGGSITGTVTAEEGGSLSGGDIYVCADFEEDKYGYGFSTCDDYVMNGDYRLDGLATGNYHVWFEYVGDNYLWEYFDDALDIESASDVSVTAGSITAGIDAALRNNDDFDSAAEITDLPYVTGQNVQGMTSASDDPFLPCGPYNSQGYGSVWYAVAPQGDTLLTAHTFGSNYDTVLTIWEGSRGSLVDLACNDDTGSLQSWVENVPLVGGATYFIEVAGYNSNLDKLSLYVVFDTMTQDISLSAGWNMISSYVEPFDPALESVLAPIESDMVLAKNCEGEVYWPALPHNGIGDWEVRDAYQIYLNNPTILSIGGRQVDPEQTPIDLPSGWSCAAYLRDNPMPIDQALNSISDELVLAKNGKGEVHWPEYDVYQIGGMLPGEGYKLYLNAPASLTYPPH